MSKKVIRFQIQKDQVDLAILPTLSSELRNIIQQFLFNWLRKANDDCEKTLKLSSFQESVDILSRYPGIQKWENPSDQELMELIQSRESADEPGRGGWIYSIKEEAACMNGTLTIYLVGRELTFPVSKLIHIPVFPGFRISEETTSD